MNDKKSVHNGNHSNFNDIFCFLYGIKELQPDALLKILSKVAITNDLDAKTVSLFANSNYNAANPNTNGNIFSEESIRDCIKELLSNEKKTKLMKYCKERAKINCVGIDEIFRSDYCSLCQYSPVYANCREYIEERVLSYSFLHGIPVELSSHSRKSMVNAFKSCIQLTISENGSYPIFSLNCALATAMSFQRLPLNKENLAKTVDEFTNRIFDMELKPKFNDANEANSDSIKKALRYHINRTLKGFLNDDGISKEQYRDYLMLLEIPYMQYLSSRRKNIPDNDILISEKEKRKQQKENKGNKILKSSSDTLSSKNDMPNFFSIFSAYAADIPEAKPEVGGTDSSLGKMDLSNTEDVIASSGVEINEKEQDDVKLHAKKDNSETQEIIASGKNKPKKSPKRNKITDDTIEKDTESCNSNYDEYSKNISAETSNETSLDDSSCPENENESASIPNIEVIDINDFYLNQQAKQYMEPEIPDDIPDELLYSNEDDLQIDTLNVTQANPAKSEKIGNPGKKSKKDSSKSSLKSSASEPSEKKIVQKENEKNENMTAVSSRDSANSQGAKEDVKEKKVSEKGSTLKNRSEHFLNIPFVKSEEVNDVDKSFIDYSVALDGILKRSKYIKVDACVCDSRIGLLFFDEGNTVTTSSFYFTSGCETILKDVFKDNNKHIFTSNSTNLYYVLGMYNIMINAHIHSLEHMCDVLNSEKGQQLTIDSYIEKILKPKRKWDKTQESCITYCMRYYESLRLHLFNSDTEQPLWDTYFAITGLEKALALYTPFFKLKDECIKRKGSMKYSFQETEVDHDCVLRVSIQSDEKHPIFVNQTPIYYHLCNAYVNARTFQSFFLDIVNINKNGIKIHYRTSRKGDLIDALWCLAQKECLRFYETAPSILVEEIA